MASKFGVMVYFLPMEKVEMFMTIMDLEGKLAKIEADKPKSSQKFR